MEKSQPKGKNKLSIIPTEIIAGRIYLFRGKKVMLDRDLAELYGVETKKLNQGVKRNIERFPADFMFSLDKSEEESLRSQFVTLESQNNEEFQGVDSLRSQFVTSKTSIRSQFVTASRQGKGGRRYAPLAFTEQGVAMLSSVLKSDRAVQVNIQIMRTFTRMRELLATNQELRAKLEELERKYDGQFAEVFEALRLLMTPPQAEPAPEEAVGEDQRKIGFQT